MFVRLQLRWAFSLVEIYPPPSFQYDFHGDNLGYQGESTYLDTVQDGG